MPVPTEEEKRWISHYWEYSAKVADATGRTSLPLAAIEQRIVDLQGEITRRLGTEGEPGTGKPTGGLIAELRWREQQVKDRKGQT